MFTSGSNQILFVFVAVLFAALILYTVIRGLRGRDRKKRAARLSVEAVAESRRMDYSGSRANTFDGHVPAAYYVAFRLQGGDLLELAVDASTYAAAADGDKGILTFQGMRFLGFEKR